MCLVVAVQFTLEKCEISLSRMYSIGLNFLYFSRKCTGNSALYYTFPGQGHFTFLLVLVAVESEHDSIGYPPYTG